MQEAESAVAVFYVRQDYAEGDNIGQFFKADLFFLQLTPDGVGGLFPARNGWGHVCIVKEVNESLRDFFYNPRVPFAESFNFLRNVLVFSWINLCKGQVFELALQRLKPHATCKGRENVKRLHSDLSPLPGIPDAMEGAHIMEAITKLNQKDAEILGDKREEIVEVF
jgi:hypothetical protein